MDNREIALLALRLKKIVEWSTVDPKTKATLQSLAKELTDFLKKSC